MSGEEVLYQKRIPIYPRSVKGRYRSLKYAILFLAYAVYFLLPWLPWSRTDGPDQTILFDIVGRRFYLFDLTVYAQDIFWLAGILIVAAFLLFFVTGIAGRVFCGYFCFQTLWTDVYQLIERLVQGERNARMKLAGSPWNGNKIMRMSLTWLLWLAVAFWTGFSFTLYWSEAPLLLQQFFSGQAPFPAYATTLFLTATTFVMAGLAREQVCTYMCPYARFQSAMFDSDTLIVAYDEQRGERNRGRAKPEKGLLEQQQRIEQGVGDCIDCGYCVQVCPTGIDIRNGMQYQCISCALCVDACNTIMRAIKYPTGLIRYTSENQIQGKRTHWFKLKTVGYGLLILIAVGLLSWSIGHRTTIEMSIRQTRQPLYVTLSDGSILNRYEIKVNNKQSKQVDISLSLQGLDDAHVEFRPSAKISLGPGQSASYQARVWLKPEAGEDHEQDFVFVLHHEHSAQALVSKPASFFLPATTR
jgi:cytochrome c oxidase accessory protein FixG